MRCQIEIFKRALIPLLLNSGGWRSRVAVQNASHDPTTVQLTLYRPDGTVAGTLGPYSLGSQARLSLYNELPLGFEGSAYLLSDTSEVDAVVHISDATRIVGYRALMR